jgi:two-component system OmpR family sensor kinase
MPIRIRLTLWYTLLLGAILIIFSTALYFVLEFSLHAQLDSALQDRAQQVINGIEVQAVFDQRTGQVIIPEADIFSSSSIFVQIIDNEGQLITKSYNLGEHQIPIDSQLLEQNLNGESSFQTVTKQNGMMRIFSRPIYLGPHVLAVIQVGQSLVTIENIMRQVLLFLIAGTAFFLMLAALVGAFLARKALQPIEVINRTADQIVSGQDLKQRLPCPNTNDEIDRLIETINKMLQRLDNFFQAQIRLSADVSHELRTPLTAIRGNVDLLRRGAAKSPDELDEALTDIEAELNRMSRLVADLLLLSQADAGLSLRIETVELDTIVLDVYRQARIIAADSVHVQLGHEDQAVIQGDADRLRQLLINLIINAVKHTPSGGTVTLSLHREAEWVRIIVEDTGRGIASKDLPHIFDRFYRVQENGQITGSGLGLSIAQWIAQAHDGQITVDSEINKGSVFTLWLPRNGKKSDTHPVSASNS